MTTHTKTSPQDSQPELVHRETLRKFGVERYAALQGSRRRNGYFHRYLTRMVSYNVLPGSRVLDIGCAGGDMLAALKPAHGVGIDINPAAIAAAKEAHPELTFHEMAAEDVAKLGETFDYIILSGVLPQLYDLHTALEALRSVCHDRTRIIVTTFSRLWQPVVRISEAIGWKARVPEESWIPPVEVKSLLEQCDLPIVTQKHAILWPLGVPLLSNAVNRWLTPLPVLNHMSLCTLTVARMVPRTNRMEVPKSVTVIVPARNEAGNIQPLLERIPQLGEKTEVIFVEGNSTDNTWEVVQKAVAEYRGPHAVSCCKQTGKGKGGCGAAGVRQGDGGNPDDFGCGYLGSAGGIDAVCGFAGAAAVRVRQRVAAGVSDGKEGDAVFEHDRQQVLWVDVYVPAGAEVARHAVRDEGAAAGGLREDRGEPGVLRGFRSVRGFRFAVRGGAVELEDRGRAGAL